MNGWHQDFNSPPWRTPSNLERRAAWAAKYYIRFKPGEHPLPDASASARSQDTLAWRPTSRVGALPSVRGHGTGSAK